MIKKTLTEDEEADEIVRRLSTPPVPRMKIFEARWTLQDEFISQYHVTIPEKLSKLIADEIDKEILEDLRQLYGKGNI